MGVFGAVFGCRGDVRFSGPLLEVSSGVVGFNVAMVSCLVREKVRPAWSDGGREREKVRPARSKWPKFSVFALAGRSFSRKCRWRGCAGRVFSRQPVLRPGLVGDAVHFRVAAVGGLRHAKPSDGVSPACRSLGWRHSPVCWRRSNESRWCGRQTADPLGEKSPKTALLAEWVCDLAELVGVDASIALFGAASQADASRICQLGSTTGTLNPLMRS